MNQLSDKNQQKLLLFIQCFVETPMAKLIFDDFDRLRYNQKFGGEQQCMLITGDAGCGKSSIINHYKQQHPHQLQAGFINNPVLVSRIPSKPTLESTMIELLRDLGQFGSSLRKHISNDKSLTESLITCLKKCRTELIIINEFQELIENKTREKRNQISNRLKFISEEAQIPIVLVGMPWAVKIAEEPQWSSRLLIRRQIPYFKLSENPENFIRLLMGLAKYMPFVIKPKLEEKHSTYALFSASSGCLRTLKHLLDESVKQALIVDAETLSKEHMAKAFAIYHPEETNPFLQPIDEICAREVKKYSYYDVDAHEDEQLSPLQYTDKLSIGQLLKLR